MPPSIFGPLGTGIVNSSSRSTITLCQMLKKWELLAKLYSGRITQQAVAGGNQAGTLVTFQDGYDKWQCPHVNS